MRPSNSGLGSVFDTFLGSAEGIPLAARYYTYANDKWPTHFKITEALWQREETFIV